MKGASSTLYGSGAATGVINITLKKSAKSAFAGSAYTILGTQNTATTSKTIVVVSALGGITDTLLLCAHTAAAGNEDVAHHTVFTDVERLRVDRVAQRGLGVESELHRARGAPAHACSA